MAQSHLRSIDDSKPPEKLLIGQNSCFGFEKPSQTLTNQAKRPHKSQLGQNYAKTLAQCRKKHEVSEQWRKKTNFAKQSRGISVPVARL